MQTSYIESTFLSPDTTFESPLRPKALSDFSGQGAIKERLLVMIEAAKGRNEPLGHCLFSGPPGLGKTTLAHIIAKSMGANLTVTSGPVLEKAGDLAGLLTNLKTGDVLFIDEIHRLNKQVEEYLYAAMEDFVIDLVIDSGPNARSVQLKLAPFTLVAATTRSGLLSSPLRSRFPFNARLDYYNDSELSGIIKRAAHLLKMDIVDEAAFEIAKRSRGTPRIANNLLRWVRDFAQVKGHPKISSKCAEEALTLLSIDHLGLDELDLRILSIIIDNYRGGPVGLSTIAAACGEEEETLEEVSEPYLIMKGFIEKTPRGRKATSLAYQHLKRGSSYEN